jgi:hypothetical protein
MVVEGSSHGTPHLSVPVLSMKEEAKSLRVRKEQETYRFEGDRKLLNSMKCPSEKSGPDWRMRQDSLVGWLGVSGHIQEYGYTLGELYLIRVEVLSPGCGRGKMKGLKVNGIDYDDRLWNMSWVWRR